MKPWFDAAIQLLPTGHRNNHLPADTLFNASYFEEQQFYIHWVSLDKEKLAACLPTYFEELTNTLAQQQIQCIHVWQDRYQTNPELVVSRILALLGIRKRIHARAGNVQRIDKPMAKLFCEANHLQGYANAYYHFGLFVKSEMVAVALFSKGRNMTDEQILYRSYECVRFASLQGTTVVGGLGKLIAAFKTMVGPDHIMTYVDRDWGIGEGFVKLGFTLSNITPAHCFFWDGKQRVQIKNGVQHNPKWLPIYTAGNAKYTWRKSSES